MRRHGESELRGPHRARPARPAAARRRAGVQRHAGDPGGAAGRAAARGGDARASPSTCTSASTRAAGAPSRGRPSGSPSATASASATRAACACSARSTRRSTRDRRGGRGGALLRPARRRSRRGDRRARRPAAAALHRRQARGRSPRTPSATRPIYARREGAVAAPTAGLHFTPELMAALDARGIARHFVTLHVGAGTFLPVKAEDTARAPHARRVGRGLRRDGRRAQRARAPPAAASSPSAPPRCGCWRRPRTRTAASGPFAGETAIFITPGYRFRAVDLLMTNFHLPRSTLFMLVAAFSGLETMRAAYAHAIARGLPLLFLRRRLPAASGGAAPMTRALRLHAARRPTARRAWRDRHAARRRSARRPSCRSARPATVKAVYRRPGRRPPAPTSSSATPTT